MKNINALLALDFDSGLPILNRSFIDDFENQDNVILFSGAFTAIQSLMSHVNVGKLKFFSTFEYNICISSNNRFACVGVISPFTLRSKTEDLLDKILSLLTDSLQGLSQISFNDFPINPEIDRIISEFNSDSENSDLTFENYDLNFYLYDNNVGFVPFKIGNHVTESTKSQYLIAWLNNVWNKIHDFSNQKILVFLDILNEKNVVICNLRQISDSKIGALLFSCDCHQLIDLAYSRHLFSVKSDEIFQVISRNLTNNNSIDIADETILISLFDKFKQEFKKISSKKLTNLTELLGIEELGNIYDPYMPNIITALITGHPIAVIGEKELTIPIINLFSSLTNIKDFALANFNSEFHRLVLIENEKIDYLKEIGYKFLTLEPNEIDINCEPNKYIVGKWMKSRELTILERLLTVQKEIVQIWDLINIILVKKNFYDVSKSYDKELSNLILKILNWLNPILFPGKDNKKMVNQWW